MRIKCSHGKRKGSGTCKRKPGPKRGHKASRRGKGKSCRFGVSKTTGRCLKTKRSRRR